MATKVPSLVASNGQPCDREEKVSFVQMGIPKKYPDVLAAVATCPCGFQMYGTSVKDLETIFERFGCPACHQSLV